MVEENIEYIDMKTYSKMVFKCDRDACGQTYNLNEFVKHSMACTSEPIPCTFGCGDQTLLKGRAEHLQHAATVCMMVPVNCITCEVTYPKHKIQDHDCFANLLEKMKGHESNTTVKALQELNN